MTETDTLQQENEHLRRALGELARISTALTSTLNLEELLGLIMSSATELLDAEGSSLLLVDPENNDLVFALSADAAEQRVPAGQGIAGSVAERGEAEIVADPRSDDRFYTGIDDATGFETRNILAVPLRAKDRVIGVVEVINKRDGAFGGNDMEFATALANQAAVAIENARLYASLADAVVTSRMSYRL
jgi:sigma-B regulation protein RsbU (phosphoserine phosphatase)